MGDRNTVDRLGTNWCHVQYRVVQTQYSRITVSGVYYSICEKDYCCASALFGPCSYELDDIVSILASIRMFQ